MRERTACSYTQIIFPCVLSEWQWFHVTTWAHASTAHTHRMRVQRNGFLDVPAVNSSSSTTKTTMWVILAFFSALSTDRFTFLAKLVGQTANCEKSAMSWFEEKYIIPHGKEWMIADMLYRAPNFYQKLPKIFAHALVFWHQESWGALLIEWTVPQQCFDAEGILLSCDTWCLNK